eukprot:420446_1
MARITFYVGIILIATVLAHLDDPNAPPNKKKVHHCVHDERDHYVRHQHVAYNDHPYDRYDDDDDDDSDDDIDADGNYKLNANSKRKLASDSDYQPIRIVPYYDETITSTSSVLTADQKQYIKSLISTSIHHFEQFIRVIPVDGPLFVDPCDGRYPVTYSSNPFTWMLCKEEDLDQKCGSHVIVPFEHQPDIWVYDYYHNASLYRKSGPGIADADLVIYVSYDTSDSSCASGNTLAYAGACVSDQFGRPIAGSINLCPGVVSTQFWKYDAVTVLHELTHILVMSSSLWNNFWTYSTVVVNTTDNAWIVTDKVKEVARAHFDCDTLIGAPLENNYGAGTAVSHWEGKYLMHEYMIGVAFSSLERVSVFTLALMEDSGWYQVDYDFAEPYVWGKDAGCAFLTGECVTSSQSNYPQFWCESEADDGCSADYAGVGDCLVFDRGTIPDKFRWYSDVLGGPKFMDYCGFIEPTESSTHADFEHICWDERGNQYDTRGMSSDTYGLDSRCVDTVSDSGTRSGYCFKHECVGFDSSTSQWSQVVITANTETITCSRADAFSTKTVSSVAGLSTVTCPNVDAVCGTTSKPFECYWGEYSEELSKCLCAVGYIGSTCNTKDNVNLVEEAQTGTYAPETSTSHQTVCIGGIDVDNARFMNGPYALQSRNDGVEAFYNASKNANTGIWVYFKRYGSSWMIGNDKGNDAGFAVCNQFSNLNIEPDIEECEEWWVYNQVEYVEAEGATATYDVQVCDDATCFVNTMWKHSVFVLLIVSALF